MSRVGTPARWSLLLSALLIALPAFAGERTPGKYSGAVVFDRWDGCTLYSGVYVMYVSQNCQEDLREHAGTWVQVDATEVSQPQNPGDGLITELTHLGAPPPTTRNWISLSGLTLRAAADFKEGEKPSVAIVLANGGKKEVTVFGSELAPTLLIKSAAADVADGPSYALVTRQAFISGGSEPRTSGRGHSPHGDYAWEIDRGLPAKFVLKPGEERRIRIAFDLPAGEYDFLAGYGGGVHQELGLASNLVAFDVDDRGGRRAIVERK
jgi:hypothetical protein